MNKMLVYRLSIGLSIVLTLTAFITLLGWFGTLINGVGRLPALELIPWSTLGTVVLAAINCSLRARLIVRRTR